MLDASTGALAATHPVTPDADTPLALSRRLAAETDAERRNSKLATTRRELCDQLVDPAWRASLQPFGQLCSENCHRHVFQLPP